MVYAILNAEVRYGPVIGPCLLLAAQCLLCSETKPGEDEKPAAPLRVEVGAGLDFDRVALTAPTGGSVLIDPWSRARTLSGALSSLGGLAMTGTATVRGEPGRGVRVELPASVSLRTHAGGSAEISRLVTDLPPDPRLGPDGTLTFSFGGRLDVSGDLDGDYRGRVTITVDYQ